VEGLLQPLDYPWLQELLGGHAPMEHPAAPDLLPSSKARHQQQLLLLHAAQEASWPGHCPALVTECPRLLDSVCQQPSAVQQLRYIF
jgi:hypothetical protein